MLQITLALSKGCASSANKANIHQGRCTHMPEPGHITWEQRYTIIMLQISINFMAHKEASPTSFRVKNSYKQHDKRLITSIVCSQLWFIVWILHQDTAFSCARRTLHHSSKVFSSTGIRSSFRLKPGSCHGTLY